jgi:uncharacterized membrane protein YhaH (DUF805 family)
LRPASPITSPFPDARSGRNNWYWFLFSLIGVVVAGIIDAAVFPDQELSPVSALFNLVTFLPSLAIGIRRLHDIDRSGWWVLLAFTVIGVFVLLYWACKRGTRSKNRFGPDPIE